MQQGFRWAGVMVVLMWGCGLMMGLQGWDVEAMLSEAVMLARGRLMPCGICRSWDRWRHPKRLITALSCSTVADIIFMT